MQINYRLIGTKELKKVYVRLYHNKLNLPASTNLVSRAENWDEKAELFKKNKIANKQLIDLKLNIEEAFNTDFSKGVILNTQWLKDIISKTFSRPSKEENLINLSYTIYLSEFAQHWLDIDSKTWKNSNSEVLTNKEKSKKTGALKQFIKFEKKSGEKIKLKDFTVQKIKDFYDFLIGEKYSVSTAKKILYEMKTFCKRANEMKINVCLDYEKNTPFKDKSTKVKDIYLNENEINSIFKYDFSDNETMDIIRDNFILSLWTGKRISDLMNLNFEHIINGTIESIDKKTNALVALPIHSQIQFILDKRFGHLPPKVNKDVYNAQIKEICRLCGINTMTYGKVFDSDKGRKTVKYYMKYELVTSHTARRSFATNMSKIVSIEDVAKLGGWTNTKMVEHYNKETISEVAEKAGKAMNINQHQ